MRRNIQLWCSNGIKILRSSNFILFSFSFSFFPFLNKKIGAKINTTWNCYYIKTRILQVFYFCISTLSTPLQADLYIIISWGQLKLTKKKLINYKLLKTFSLFSEHTLIKCWKTEHSARTGCLATRLIHFSNKYLRFLTKSSEYRPRRAKQRKV